MRGGFRSAGVFRSAPQPFGPSRNTLRETMATGYCDLGGRCLRGWMTMRLSGRRSVVSLKVSLILRFAEKQRTEKWQSKKLGSCIPI